MFGPSFRLHWNNMNLREGNSLRCKSKDQNMQHSKFLPDKKHLKQHISNNLIYYESF